MVVCQLDQQPTIRSFTAQVIGMCQATNTQLLEPSEWGLSNPSEEEDDPNSPVVFLHPDTAISLIVGEQGDEAELDLNRLKAARVKPSPRVPSRVQQPVDADDEPSSNSASRNGAPSVAAARLSHQPSFTRISSDDEQQAGQWLRLFKVVTGRGADKEVRWSRDPSTVKSHFDPPDTPLPAQQTAMRYVLLKQLKHVTPPAGALPPGLVCLLPPSAQPPALTTALTATQLAVPTGSQRDLNRSASSSALSPQPQKQAAKSKQEKKAEDDRRRERDKEVATIDAVLVSLAAKGVGSVRPVRTVIVKKKRGDEEDDEEDSAEMEEERQRRVRFAWCGGEREVPLLFASLPAPPVATPNKQKKKAEATDNCFVLTSLRALTIENGVVVAELRIGPGSGGVVSVPKRRPVETAGGSEVVRMRWKVRLLSNEQSNVSEMGDDDDSNSDEGDEMPAEGDEVPEDEEVLENGHSGRRISHSRPRFSYVTLSVPSTQQVAYIRDYVFYMQSTVTLTQTLSTLSSSSAMSSSLQSASSSAQHALLGWTVLLKSFMGPLVFGPLRLPLYTHQIKQLLARVQQMQLKNVAIHSLKLMQFHLPHPELTSEGEEQLEDFIPSLSLRSFRGHPHHEYTFDVRWSCPSFLVRVEITGKKVVSFRLELEMRGIEVAGCVLLRSTPYAPEQLAVSFAAVPSLSFGVASQVVVGSVRMPAAVQQSLERLIAQQVQKVLAQQINERAIHPKWVSVYFPTSPLSLLLNRWWSVAKFPFKFDGRDDEEMMGLALVVTTQAEAVVSDTLREMRQMREEMEGWLTRPLYGEDEGSDWQDKEKQRMREQDEVKRRQEDEEGTGGRKGKGKKKKAKATEDDEPPVINREASRKKK